MFPQRQMFRFFSSSSSIWSSSKSHLAKLRKKTGYTFSNCKKALEMHNNDIELAEKWLHDQAQALGWSKATNLGGRKATEGLVAVAMNKSHGAMVELNCETDFVSRNSTFQSLIKMVANSCLSMVPQMSSSSSPLRKEYLDNKKLSELPAPDGKTLADHVALTIGQVGENMVLKRAVLLATNENIFLSGYSHPSSTIQDEPMFGKYAAVVAFRTKDGQPASDENCNLGRKICQHVVGMNPKSIGDKEKDKPQESADDETVMIFQEYLLDPDTKVEEVLDEGNLEVVDFVRYECGETDVDAEEASAARSQG